jgi:hypothetical protein
MMIAKGVTIMINQPQVNDKVIYVPTANAEPQITVITRLTPTGQIGIAESSKPFRRNAYGETCFVQGNAWADKGRVYEYSDGALRKLQDMAKARRDAETERQAEQKRQIAEREQHEAEQLAEVQRVCNYELPIISKEILPDSTRFYQLSVPLNPEKNAEPHNRVFDRLLVHCRDTTHYNFKTSTQEPCVEASRTVITALRAINGLCSYKGDDDESALWESVKDRYFDWS